MLLIYITLEFVSGTKQFWTIRTKIHIKVTTVFVLYTRTVIITVQLSSVLTLLLDRRGIGTTYALCYVLFFFSFFFSVRLLSVLRGHSVFSSPPQRPMTSDFEGFSIPDFIHYIYFPILILEKEPVFPLLNVQC